MKVANFHLLLRSIDQENTSKLSKDKLDKCIIIKLSAFDKDTTEIGPKLTNNFITDIRGVYHKCFYFQIFPTPFLGFLSTF